MCVESIVKWAQVFGYIVGSSSLIISALVYRKNNRVKRGEWLKSLFEKFYEQEKFQKIRREIEYDTLEEFLKINDEKKASSVSNEEELVNYLNFFEFISVLVKRGHLDQDEINDLFGYYLKSIRKDKYLKSYIAEYDFENLEALLKKYE